MIKNAPDYMLIGCQKAGSTWLYENLVKHPQVAIPMIFNEIDETELTRKEISFFNDTHRYSAGIDFYTARFAVKKEGQVIGDHTITYHDMPESKVKLISELFPSLKILLLIRNPIDRAWSQIKMQNGLKRKNIYDMQEIDMYKHFSYYAKFGLCYASLAVWRKYYKEEQIKILFFEDIKEQPENMLKSVFGFLGIKTEIDYSQFPVREYFVKGTDEPIPTHIRTFLVGIYEPEIRALVAEFGDKIKHWNVSDG